MTKNKISFVDSGSNINGFFAETQLGPNNKPTGVINLFNNFYGGEKELSFSEQAVTLVHELLHAAFNLTAADHSDIVARFKISTVGFFSNSLAINSWIARDCQ